MLNFSGTTFIHVAELEIIYDHQQGGTENKTNYIWNLLATRLIVSSMERPKCKPLSCEMSQVMGNIERQL